MDSWWNILLPIILVVVGYLFGHFLGSLKFFHEHKLRMYEEALPALLRYLFTPGGGEIENKFNQALSKMWLYGNKDVCDKMDEAITKRMKPSQGNFVPALQEFILEMRKDIQPIWRWKKRQLSEGQPKHFFFDSGQK